LPNPDGFGAGWFQPSYDPLPATYVLPLHTPHVLLLDILDSATQALEYPLQVMQTAPRGAARYDQVEGALFALPLIHRLDFPSARDKVAEAATLKQC
jgi:hypothetical protein